ncbi:hypothetical protein BJX96DRAFT_170441 [Aspergillus floccosus]
MSTPQNAPVVPGARIAKPTFLAIIWTFTGLSLFFVIFRLTVRLAQSRRFGPDDLLVVIAWTILLVTAIIWQAKSSILYYHYLVDEGAAQWTKEFENQYSDFIHFLAPLMILFYIGLWCIKFSFLVFFYNLGSKITSHRVWWWVVFAITTAAFITSIADYDYKCSEKSLDYIISHLHFQNYYFYVNFAVDVATDLLILSIPILILWEVRLPLRKKLVLGAVFSVIMITIAVSTIRVAVNRSSDTNVDVTWLYFWSFVELSIAIVVSCMAAFRQLFVTSHNQHLYRNDFRSLEGSRACGRFRWRRRPGESLHSADKSGSIGEQAQAVGLKTNDGERIGREELA